MKQLLVMTNRGIEHFNRCLGWMLAILLLVMTVLICWQVFARFVIGKPLYFSEEIARFSMLWLTFLGAGYAFRKSRLISVDIVLEYAGPWLAKFMRVLVVLVSLVFAIILIKYGFDIVDRVAFQTAPSTRVSMMWPYLSVPIGGIVILINAVGLLIDECIGTEE